MIWVVTFQLARQEKVRAEAVCHLKTYPHIQSQTLFHTYFVLFLCELCLKNVNEFHNISNCVSLITNQLWRSPEWLYAILLVIMTCIKVYRALSTLFVFISQPLYTVQTLFKFQNVLYCTPINCTQACYDDMYSLWVSMSYMMH